MAGEETGEGDGAACEGHSRWGFGWEEGGDGLSDGLCHVCYKRPNGLARNRIFEKASYVLQLSVRKFARLQEKKHFRLPFSEDESEPN